MFDAKAAVSKFDSVFEPALLAELEANSMLMRFMYV
jgi:CRP/FNR family transcriptional regulator